MKVSEWNTLVLGDEYDQRTKWTYEKCKQEAIGCTSQKQFNRKCSSAYQKARKAGWLDEICPKQSYNVKIVYTKEKCHEAALKFTKRSEFKKHCRSEYEAASRRGWLAEIQSHMREKALSWTFEKCVETVEKYPNIEEFKRNERDCKLAIYRNGWQSKIFPNYDNEEKCRSDYDYYISDGKGSKKRPHGYWNFKEHCHEAALQYRNRTEFFKNNPTAYERCRRKGWLNEVCSHMPRKIHRSPKSNPKKF